MNKIKVEVAIKIKIEKEHFSKTSLYRSGFFVITKMFPTTHKRYTDT